MALGKKKKESKEEENKGLKIIEKDIGNIDTTKFAKEEAVSDDSELKLMVEDLVKINAQLLQVTLYLNDQLTLALTGLNYISSNQMELGQLFSGNPPENLEMYRAVVKPELIEQLKIKTRPTPDDKE